MTSHSNFKALVRARMEKTGQNYTSARADILRQRQDDVVRLDLTHLTESQAEALRDHRAVLSKFVRDGQLQIWPSKRRARAHVLLWLVNFFEPGTQYSEKTVNQILVEHWSDYAFLRRELVDYGYLARDNSGVYWLADSAIDRTGTILHEEAPAWEPIWLPAYLAGKAESYK